LRALKVSRFCDNRNIAREATIKATSKHMTATCARQGCSRAVFIEPRTQIAHLYCGRTHALEAENTVQAPHGLCHACNLSGCTQTVAIDHQTGRVHDFCCKAHASKAIDSGAWPCPHMGCSLPGCSLPVFTDAVRNLLISPLSL
jgi:hypothetical protein